MINLDSKKNEKTSNYINNKIELINKYFRHVLDVYYNWPCDLLVREKPASEIKSGNGIFKNNHNQIEVSIAVNSNADCYDLATVIELFLKNVQKTDLINQPNDQGFEAIIYNSLNNESEMEIIILTYEMRDKIESTIRKINEKDVDFSTFNSVSK